MGSHSQMLSHRILGNCNMSTIPQIRSISTDTNKQTPPSPKHKYNQNRITTPTLPPHPPLLPGMEYLEEHSSPGTGGFITDFLTLVVSIKLSILVMFNFETRSNFICMPGIFSTESTSLLLAWHGLKPTVAVESHLYFPVGSVWGPTLSSQMCTQVLKLCLHSSGRGCHKHAAEPEKYIVKELLDADYYMPGFL